MKIFIVLSLTILLSGSNSFAQQWESFTTQNSGLPSNNVFAVEMDEMGIIWFGSDSGVTGFDGSNWRTYTPAEGLADHQVNDLKLMEHTELWAATSNGVSALGFSSLDAVTMATPYRTDNTALLSNQINSLAIDQNHIRWFATDSGVTVFTSQNWVSTRSQRVVLNHDVLAIDIGPDLITYCGTEGGGVARLKLSGFDIITGASTIERPWAPVPIDSVTAIHIGADSLQWFGTTQGLFQHRGINSKVNWKRFTVSDGLPHPLVQAIAEDAVGQIWVGTKAGVACIQKDLSSSKNYSTVDGLIDNDVRDIAVAAEGSIWLATAGGVSKFSPRPSQVHSPKTAENQQRIKLDIYPNPFNSTTFIEYHFTGVSVPEIAIYNLAGQRVRTLWTGRVSGGHLVVEWNGQNDRGSAVPSGLYLVRCSNGGQLMNQKIMFIK